MSSKFIIKLWDALIENFLIFLSLPGVMVAVMVTITVLSLCHVPMDLICKLIGSLLLGYIVFILLFYNPDG